MDRRDFLKAGGAALALTMFDVTSAGKKICVQIKMRLDILPKYNHSLQISAKYKAQGRTFQYANLYDEWNIDDMDSMKHHFEQSVRFAMNKSFKITDIEFKWQDTVAMPKANAQG